jgi:DNA-binding cell septation regulator SpoVG
MEKVLDIKVKRIHRINNSDFLKAFADIVVNDAILIKGLKVLERRDGFMVAMPSEQAKDNKWYDSVRCLDEDVKEQIKETVLQAYRE